MRDPVTRQAVSLSLGGRDLPLEADLNADVAYDHEMVGESAEVSSIAGGSLKSHRDQKCTILGVLTRFGQIIGYKVQAGKDEHYGTCKDFYVDRSVLEDIQPPTATSMAVREGLSHWNQQRDYWHTQAAGLESLAFAVASVTPRATTVAHEWGWEFVVPDPMPGDQTQVRCLAFQHGNFWTLGTTVIPVRGQSQDPPRIIQDHWARVFQWTYEITLGMVERGWPWEQAARNIQTRALATAKVLVPLANQILQECLDARREITGSAPTFAPGSISVGFSSVRLKPNTIGLTEPPTDRRPYTVISISPQAARDAHYLRQVLLHECIHIAVANKSGETPHNELFNAIAKQVGLEPKHRD
jgi:hypothetical protein